MGRVPKVTLMIQCKVDGIWKKVPAPMSANGRPVKVPGAMFYLRYSQTVPESGPLHDHKLLFELVLQFALPRERQIGRADDEHTFR
jgi:hypothetical protein